MNWMTIGLARFLNVFTISGERWLGHKDRPLRSRSTLRRARDRRRRFSSMAPSAAPEVALGARQPLILFTLLRSVLWASVQPAFLAPDEDYHFSTSTSSKQGFADVGDPR